MVNLKGILQADVFNVVALLTIVGSQYLMNVGIKIANTDAVNMSINNQGITWILYFIMVTLVSLGIGIGLKIKAMREDTISDAWTEKILGITWFLLVIIITGVFRGAPAIIANWMIYSELQGIAWVIMIAHWLINAIGVPWAMVVKS